MQATAYRQLQAPVAPWLTWLYLHLLIKPMGKQMLVRVKRRT